MPLKRRPHLFDEKCWCRAPPPSMGGKVDMMHLMAQNNFTSSSPQRRSGLLRDQVKLSKRKDGARCEIVPIQESLSFEKGFFIMIRACQLLAQNNEGMVFVGVAGPSGAGKTVFTERVLSFMPSIAVLSMDNYNDASRIIDGNFDDPRLTDYDTLLKNIHDLKEGKSIQVPVYDFKSSSRTGYRTVEVPSSRIVIIEGIYALNEKLRPFLDLRVSVTGGVHFDLVKRVLRDIQRAGQEPEEIIHQISETVYPMYKAFIEPDLQTAHIKISNKFNPFSGFQNPTYILKSSKTVSLDKIKAIFATEYTEKFEETYDIYLLPPGEDHEACQSYLRMRNRDGKYNLMFEEWVTDSPFIISPRISFEVSVRLLGGLMALGYTIATILRRSSHIFSDDKVIVKIDWLEQFGRHYLQVQGRDRHVVKCTAEQLDLDGSYVSRTYIEQIQLEKIMNEVTPLPDDLKMKLSISEEMCVSPKDTLFRAPADIKAIRKHLKSGMSQSYTDQGDSRLTDLTRIAANGRKLEVRIPDNKDPISELSDQLVMLNEKMDKFTKQMDDFSSKISMKTSSSQESLVLQGEVLCNGSTPTSDFLHGLGNRKLMLNSLSCSQLAKDSTVIEEINLLSRGQRQMMHQLENLVSLVHKRTGEPTNVRSKDKSNTMNSTTIRSPLVWTLALGGFGIFLFKGFYQN